MDKKNGAPRPIYSLLPTDLEDVDCLAELALDLRWSWNHATDGVWRTLDPRLWELTHNPWVVLQTVSRDHLQRVLADAAFRKSLDDLLQAPGGRGSHLVSVQSPASRLWHVRCDLPWGSALKGMPRRIAPEDAALP